MLNVHLYFDAIKCQKKHNFEYIGKAETAIVAKTSAMTIGTKLKAPNHYRDYNVANLTCIVRIKILYGSREPHQTRTGGIYSQRKRVM